MDLLRDFWPNMKEGDVIIPEGVDNGHSRLSLNTPAGYKRRTSRDGFANRRQTYSEDRTVEYVQE